MAAAELGASVLRIESLTALAGAGSSRTSWLVDDSGVRSREMLEDTVLYPFVNPSRPAIGYTYAVALGHAPSADLAIFPLCGPAPRGCLKPAATL